MQNFNKSILLATIFALTSCASQKGVGHNENGSYDYRISSGANSTDVIVRGTITDQVTKQPISAAASVKLDDIIIANTDDNGNYTAKLKAGTYRFVGVGMPYRFCKTKTISVAAGDSLLLNFALVLNTEKMN